MQKKIKRTRLPIDVTPTDGDKELFLIAIAFDNEEEMTMRQRCPGKKEKIKNVCMRAFAWLVMISLGLFATPYIASTIKWYYKNILTNHADISRDKEWEAAARKFARDLLRRGEPVNRKDIPLEIRRQIFVLNAQIENIYKKHLDPMEFALYQMLRTESHKTELSVKGVEMLLFFQMKVDSLATEEDKKVFRTAFEYLDMLSNLDLSKYPDKSDKKGKADNFKNKKPQDENNDIDISFLPVL